MGGLNAIIAAAMAFGAGSAMGGWAVDAIGDLTVPTSASSAASAPSNTCPSGFDACGVQIMDLSNCINNYRSDISKCQIYMDMLKECRKSRVYTLAP